LYCFVAAYMANKDNGGESIFNSQMKHKISVWSESDFHMTVTQACTFTVGTHCQQLLSFNISSFLNVVSESVTTRGYYEHRTAGNDFIR